LEMDNSSTLLPLKVLLSVLLVPIGHPLIRELREYCNSLTDMNKEISRTA